MPHQTLILGQILIFDGDPFVTDWQEAVHIDTRGGILIEDGMITAVGKGTDLQAAHPGAEVVAYEDKLVLPGFIDAHVHYPQTGIIASWGKRLIDWLNCYTFPEEMRFGDADYAKETAECYLDLTRANGTTSFCSFATIHPESVEALFTAAARRNQRIVTGKTCMDRNAPEGLCDTAQSAYDHSKALLEKWHGKGRATYAITPRFSPTSTPEQLEALGALWAEHPEVLMQTHLSEQLDEIEWVKSLYPQARDYLDTYESFGLLGARGVYGHAIHMEPREMDRLRDIGAGVVHCPTSNTFIGSGLFQLAKMKTHGNAVGLATDTGGGSSFSMLRTMAAAYEIGQLSGTAFHPAQLLWLATAGSARTLHLQDHIGSLAAGKEADICVLDLASTPAIAQRSRAASDIWEAIFPTIMMGDDRAIVDVWINGQRSQ